MFYNSERPQVQNNRTINIDDALNILCHLKEVFYDRKCTLGRTFGTETCSHPQG